MPFTKDSREFDALVQANPKAIKILAEGDSWLAYPRQFFLFGKNSNIVDCLGDKPDIVAYSSSENGDEAVAMLCGEQKLALMKRIKHTDFDVILFSGGGNDLVGRYDFGFFLQKMTGNDWQSCIRHERLNKKLNQISLSYEELIERALEFSSNKKIKIISHSYDYAIPSKTGFELFDIFPMSESWMFPYLSQLDINQHEDQKSIAKYMLVKFQEMLLALEAKYPQNFYVVQTQGTLKENQWRNEIHPTPEGFKVISEMIYKKIKMALAS
ncbi:SGNH/GDSL hydrolase family protein [Iodobacter sp. CM08]|uniref:SGNH/GDSL hydrolase family protein n=1 Tax=Iodobacter sp. CM08 TaxID=3085902 RepID=UPI0029826DA5|nr:SGNH/GDSL hydrolase family protein [Iodobacter sp. CM08]MDW5415723.1 SGNH/GDSL hydrolase family protein [Iodobacter sp. CM08]